MRAPRKLIHSIKIADVEKAGEILRSRPYLALTNGLLHIAMNPLRTVVPLGTRGKTSQPERRCEMVDLLLSAGVSVHTADANGVTPLHLAVQMNLRHAVSALLAHGAKLDAADRQGETPLFRAIDRGYGELTELLLNRGADPNASNRSGETPLHRAVQKRRLSLIPILLSYQAVMETQDHKGLTPLQAAADDDVEALGDIFSRYEGVHRLLDSFGPSTMQGTGYQEPALDLSLAPLTRPMLLIGVAL